VLDGQPGKAAELAQNDRLVHDETWFGDLPPSSWRRRDVDGSVPREVGSWGSDFCCSALLGIVITKRLVFFCKNLGA